MFEVRIAECDDAGLLPEDSPYEPAFCWVAWDVFARVCIGLRLAKQNQNLSHFGIAPPHPGRNSISSSTAV
ncbi:hypothetical protein pipiens_006035 [Culex pipiens pipiens]|uniref:Uncharacterized protein n=1 Tax=Culex pipiens pipiens TaxID=38569 RepID=A0ABD1DS24_CULPP